MKSIKNMVLALGVVLALALPAQAQTFDGSAPATALTGGLSSAQTLWLGFAGLSAAAFVFGMVIAYGRKAKK
jgi:hypothetical protein